MSKYKSQIRQTAVAMIVSVMLMTGAAAAQMSEVDFDLLSARMAKALKDGEFEKALPMIEQIKSSGRDYTPSLIYFEGFALENLGRLAEAEATYRSYLERAGKSGAYYNKALARVVEIEDKLEKKMARYWDLQNVENTDAVKAEMAQLEAALGERAAPIKAAREEAEAAALVEQTRKAEEEAARKAVEAEQKAKRMAAEAEAAMRRPGHKFKDCDGCPEMVIVPAGQFVMGSPDNEEHRKDNEGPQRTVTIPKIFAIGVLEVTHGEFVRFVRETGYTPDAPCQRFKMGFFRGKYIDIPNWPNASYPQTDRHPVVCVGRPDAKAYAAWLSQKTGASYRLPTEAEWEYSARAGTQTPHFYGEDRYFEKICAYGNTLGYISPACTTDGYGGMAPVGQYKPNAFGLYDTIGNATEWVEDCYADSYANAPTDGSAYVTPACESGFTRGGRYHLQADYARSASRLGELAEKRVEWNGFRIARDIE